MSYWTYITGAVEVSAPGRTQAEIDYILQTVLDHLPRVTGSEGDMEIHINRHEGDNTSQSCDEFEMNTNNLTDNYGNKSYRRGWLRMQDRYTLTLHAALRDRFLEQTIKEFMKWLCRLAKRIRVDSVLVRITDWEKSIVLNDNMGSDSPYWQMYEYPSWASGNDDCEPAWWEYLMWNRYDDSPLPIEHIVKYYDCPEAKEEFQKQTRR